MEINNIREKYKVNKSNVEKAYEYQLGLKNDPEFEKRVDDTFIQIVTVLRKLYPNVKIRPPKGREKSARSLKIKIEDLEIERLCKLYAIEGISDEEKQDLYNAIIKSTKNKEKDRIENICFGEIKNLEDIESIIKIDEIPEKTKTALLRILKTRLRREEIENKEDLENELDEKYGVLKFRKTGMYKDDLIRWNSIENISQLKRNNLHNPFEFLKVKDIRGIQLIIASVPEDIQTDSERLEENIEVRSIIENKIQDLKNAEDINKENIDKLESEKEKYNDLCTLEFAKEFSLRLVNSPELLKKLNIMVIPEGYKHKEKQNGYIAEHIKFCYIDKPEYVFELQVLSEYRESLSKANGPADHANRSGKKRKLPNLSSGIEFIRDAKNIIPQYRYIKIVDGQYKIHKCRTLENIMEYYFGYVELTDEQREKVFEYIKEGESASK